MDIESMKPDELRAELANVERRLAHRRKLLVPAVNKAAQQNAVVRGISREIDDLERRQADVVARLDANGEA